MTRKREEREKIKVTKSSIKKARTFFHFIKPYRWYYVIGLITLFISSLVSLSFPYLLGGLLGNSNTSNVGTVANNINLDSLLPKDTTSIVTLLFIVFAIQAVFSFFRIYLFGWVTENALKDFRAKAFHHLITSPINFFNKNKVGELTSRIASDINTLSETLNSTIAEFIRQVIMVIGGIILILIFSPKLSLIMLATVPVIVVIALFFGRFIRNLSKKAQDSAAESNSVLEESLTSIINVKAFTNELFETLKYGKAIDDIKKISLKALVWRGAFASFIIFCMFGSIIFIIWQGTLMVENGEMSQDNFYRFIFFTIFISTSIGSLPSLYASIQKSIGSTENLMDILDLDTEKVSLGKTKQKISGNITFDNVSFTYETRKDLKVLNNISFEIKEGQRIALVGSSGAGKSTIASLLLQFYKVEEGNILFDNKKAEEYHLSTLRENMAIVPQEVILFGSSIYDNIKYGNINASEEEIIEATKKAYAHDFIEEFPEKYQTLVGDRGIQLSGGQKQRIAIARAILKNPSVLILDEATSALDSTSEKEVQKALDNLMQNRSSLIIAHRLSTIKNCDKIIVLEKGEIVEIGTHQDLMSTDYGVYKNLVELQQLKE